MAFCTDKTSQNNRYGWQDPMGPTSIGKNGKATFSPTGAPQMRSTLFNYLGTDLPGMTQAGGDYASALKGAASNAGWGQASDLASNVFPVPGTPSTSR